MTKKISPCPVPGCGWTPKLLAIYGTDIAGIKCPICGYQAPTLVAHQYLCDCGELVKKIAEQDCECETPTENGWEVGLCNPCRAKQIIAAKEAGDAEK